MQSAEALLTPAQAKEYYQLGRPETSPNASDVDNQLRRTGVATIQMALTPGDFKTLTDAYEAALDYCPDVLADTYFELKDVINDPRHAHDAGHVRKEKKVNQAGVQIADPKNTFHFTEIAQEVWTQQWGGKFRGAPLVLRDFFESGFDIHKELIRNAHEHIDSLEETHPNITQLYFPRGIDESLSFMRVLSYDGYERSQALSAEVAKAHYDVGSFTIQAMADAPGFWYSSDGPGSPRVRQDSTPGVAQFFPGKEYKKIYGDEAMYRPLWHGVERILPEGNDPIPKRHAVIIFVDAPDVNAGVGQLDTVPQLATEKLSEVA